MDAQIERLRTLLDSAKRIAFLGGAGLSTESGIPDFRSEKGAFQALEAYGYPPETLLSRDFFLRHTAEFYDYYRRFLLHPEAQPNEAHRALARLEAAGKLSAV
ncbi:MAG: Sir2 family NAD-dependent protein deacetylase, partial [Clostridia bacterium]|nr:Sir2 family NAD-dependent protein deacetylase [Clostridia bacterium]